MKTGCFPALSLLAGVALAFPARAGLVGHWRFDEGTGIAIHDASGNGNDGILVNPKAGTWTTGMDGISAALRFDGIPGAGATRVTIPDSPSLHVTTALSLAVWVRPDEVGRDAPLLDKEGTGQACYWFGLFGSGNFGVLLDADGNMPWTILDRDQGSVFPGLWSHLASTWDGSVVRHYLNGVLLPQTGSFAGPVHVSDNPLVIGANSPFDNTAFKGVLGEARLYNHALGPEEIRTLVGVKPGLVAHWSFDEGGGTQIRDDSGAGNHGVLLNPTGDTWTRGLAGGALYFDGTLGPGAAYVSVPDAPSLHIAAEISFAAWVRCDDIGRDAPILAKEGEGKLSYWFGTFGLTSTGSSPGNFGTLLSNDGNQPWNLMDRDQGAVPQGQWTHLATTWDGTTVRHYMNGDALPQTRAFAGPIRFSDAFLAIGVNSLYTFAANRTAFKGAIDDVSLYNRALGPAEVRALYRAHLFRITAVQPESGGIRIAWSCIAGRRYVVQAATLATAGGQWDFTDISAPIEIPADYVPTTFEYQDASALQNHDARLYRIELLP